jgi:hypothetical protein
VVDVPEELRERRLALLRAPREQVADLPGDVACPSVCVLELVPGDVVEALEHR